MIAFAIVVVILIALTVYAVDLLKLQDRADGVLKCAAVMLGVLIIAYHSGVF